MNATPTPRRTRHPLLVTLAVLVIIAVVAFFFIVGPGPMAFSKGRKSTSRITTRRIPAAFLQLSRKHR